MYKFSLSFILAIATIQQIRSQSKLHVEVLYESLCPDSLNFITQQLHPVFKELAPYVDLKLTPFGKSASLDNGLQFVCQHGPKECKGNRIQSCVLNALPDQTAQVEYVNCFMTTFKKGQKNDEEFGQACAEAVGLEFNQISQCYATETGTKLQLLAEQSTVKVTPKFVPTILYNGVFDQQLQDNSLVDFRGVVCNILAQTYPEACQSPAVIRL
ncbi:GILT-like protein F37H8.5 [Tribolium castaneum]|uniref:GILT-like protein F37H8.5 n=1 Tax=Tribolium castaneum TaxID=7070 RepID=D2A078_TRICA|nr:PREDICTED: GILT-like protein F37H8.5 [Tribolium castaneum]EFA01735.1 GILT-like protein F37H8.5 [Tribolium castaneum]|eukprot:XP_975539.1 PREDICTED: GILT-like protein F37H8.5 [Tribolium castaneum]